MRDKEEIREQIRKRYSGFAANSSCGCSCTPGCCNNSDITDLIKINKNLGYSEADLADMPDQANMGLGCGNPLAIAALQAGDVVLDLGSGGGFDCFLARRQVGETGYVIGVDMTPEMIKLARKNAKEMGYSNIDFRLGEIEHLPVADGSVDVIISNCVVNLSVEKEKVFSEAYRVLKPGGRLSISDVVATAELPAEIKRDISMMSGCIAGAENADVIESLLKNTGFREIKLTPKDNSSEIISTWAPGRKIEDYIASYIIEAVK